MGIAPYGCAGNGTFLTGEGEGLYKDHDSLVSMGTQTSVGNLMGSLFKASWFVEGLFARAMH